MFEPRHAVGQSCVFYHMPEASRSKLEPSVTSVHHVSSGRDALNSRFIRFSARRRSFSCSICWMRRSSFSMLVSSSSCFVRPHRRRHIFRPTIDLLVRHGELIVDQGITTAILDRLLHRVEIIHGDDDSHRMRNRKSLFSAKV